MAQPEESGPQEESAPPELRPAWSLPAGAAEGLALPVEWPGEVTRDWAWGGSTGKGVTVCILDSGVDEEHPLVKGVQRSVVASVGPNATLIRGDLVAFVRDLKAKVDGELDVAGPTLAAAITPLIDEYRLYFRPIVLGGGKPYFAGARPSLRLVATDRIDDVVRLTYVPA